MDAIRPEAFAAALAFQVARPDWQHVLKSFPRLREALTFVVRMSQRPGGLEAFARRLTGEHPQFFRTAGMSRMPPPTDHAYDLKDCLRLWKVVAEERGLRDNWPFLRPDRYDATVFSGEDISFQRWLNLCVWPDLTAEDVAAGRNCRPAEIRRGVARFNYEFFHEECLQKAEIDLPDLLRAWCEEKGPFRFEGPWYCPEMPRLLCEAMDRHAESVRKTVVETPLTKRVFREVQFVWQEKEPAQYIGDSRLGKTVSFETCAEMFPGRFLFVPVPASNDMTSFMAAHATAIGLDPRKCPGALRLDVEEFILRSGVAVLYDEWHNAWPRRFSANTMPDRLDWVRCQLLDHGVGCAFMSTPQSYRMASQKFLNKTKYAQEQWRGRVGEQIVLSEMPTEEDMLAIVRLKFPEADEGAGRALVDTCILTQEYLELLPRLGHRARFIATQDGRDKMTAADVEAACGVYGLAVPEEDRPVRDLAACSQQANRRPSALPLRSPRNRAAPVSVLG